MPKNADFLSTHGNIIILKVPELVRTAMRDELLCFPKGVPVLSTPSAFGTVV